MLLFYNIPLIFFTIYFTILLFYTRRRRNIIYLQHPSPSTNTLQATGENKLIRGLI